MCSGLGTLKRNNMGWPFGAGGAMLTTHVPNEIIADMLTKLYLWFIEHCTSQLY